MTKAETPEQRLNALMERERDILKKLNVAYRAGASEQVIGQMNYLLEECRAAQFDARQMQRADKKDSDFNDFLSIG
jgi:hypothetical protein